MGHNIFTRYTVNYTFLGKRVDSEMNHMHTLGFKNIFHLSGDIICQELAVFQEGRPLFD